jgi:hypothetical protein
VGDHRRQGRAARHEREMAERPLIGEPQVGPGVGEGETDPDVRRNGPARITQQQLAAHAEVGEQGILGHRRRARRRLRHGQPQVLAAAARPGDGEPARGGGEVAGAGLVPPHRAGVQHLGRTDGAPDNVPFQAPADDLDLG